MPAAKRAWKKAVEKDVTDDASPPKKPKKTKAFAESEEMAVMRETVGQRVLAAADGSRKFLGVHVSAAGSLERAIHEARAIGCRAFAFFVRNGRTWNVSDLEDDVVQRWRAAIEETRFDVSKILPHGSYLLNPASPEEEILEKSRKTMLHECQRAEKLGIGLYNFHPGLGSVEDSCRVVAETINYIHKNTANIVLVIETMAGQGNTIGGKFSEIRQMIAAVEDKTRVGVCIDTCHVFAAGYQFNTADGYDKMMAEFEREIGFDYLKGFHINDSLDVCGACRDRHQLIGKGKIGLEGFRKMMNDERLNDIPMILETPDNGQYADEMIILHGLEADDEPPSSKENNTPSPEPQ